jgi:chloramphenicol-sensitive protein RarD
VSSRSRGLASALLAYLAWGLFPIYFKLLPGVPALEVLSHRVLWSVVLLGVAAPLLGRGGTVLHALGPGKRLAILASTLLIAANWLTYIWAVQVGRVLEASMGYFVNPLLSVLLGVVFLRERLRRFQVVAIALAGVGVVVLVVRLGTFPWLPLTLALSFGLYGLVRKRAAVDAVGGLLAETALLAPAALALVLLRAHAGVGAFGHDLRVSLLLAAAGPVTAVPLVLFALGVQRLRLATVGILQYLTPTLQFLLAVGLYREPFLPAHALAFGFIWLALAVYTWDSVRATRGAGPPGTGNLTGDASPARPGSARWSGTSRSAGGSAS